MRPFTEVSRTTQRKRLRHLGEVALLNYGIRDAKLRFVSDTANTVFRVDTPGQRYALRIAPDSPTDQAASMLRAEVFWLDTLRRDTELRVPEPVSTQTDDLVQGVATDGVPEGRLVTLLRWMPGQLIKERPTRNVLTQMGAFMAQLHSHVQRFTLPDGLMRFQTTWDKLLFWQEPSNDTSKTLTHKQRDLCALASKRLLADIAQIGTEREYGLIHADLHLHNCLLHKRRLCVIDFDDCRFASYFYDMAVPLTYLDARQDYATLRAAFYEGYAAIRSLPDGCEVAVQTFMVARAFDIVEWIHFDWPDPSYFSFGPELLSRAIGRIRSYMQ